VQVLALDTTGRAGSIAIVRGERAAEVVAERPGDPARSHAERLPSALLDLLAAHRLTAAAIDCFAVATGPGSFTGLRIGIATMQGLALVTRRPMVGVSALVAAAHLAADTCREGDRIGVWMDGYRREVFAALFAVTDEPSFSLSRLTEIEGPTVGRPDAVLDRWQRADVVPSLLVGDGADLYRDQVIARVGRVPILGMPLLAGAVGRLAIEHARRGETVTPSGIQPLYVRRPDAELARDHALADRRPDVAS
jgi:tRNA threonylcarbamoyladenosine biosynthesis protein TsaB